MKETENSYLHIAILKTFMFLITSANIILTSCHYAASDENRYSSDENRYSLVHHYECDLPPNTGLATASGYVGEPVAYRDGLVYMYMVGDESAAGSMYYQLFEYDGDFIPVSPAADRVFRGDEYVVYMNVDRSTGECEYFADSYDFDNRTELVLPDGCGLCFIDGERLYYT